MRTRQDREVATGSVTLTEVEVEQMTSVLRLACNYLGRLSGWSVDPRTMERREAGGRGACKGHSCRGWCNGRPAEG